MAHPSSFHQLSTELSTLRLKADSAGVLMETLIFCEVQVWSVRPLPKLPAKLPPLGDRVTL